MPRPLPQSEPTTDLARTLRETSAHMLEDAADAGLLAPLYLLIAQAIAALFGRLADLADLWRAGLLPAPLPAAPRAPTPRAAQAARRNRSTRTRRAPRPVSVRRAIARPRFALKRAAARPAAPPAARPVERYPKR